MSPALLQSLLDVHQRLHDPKATPADPAVMGDADDLAAMTAGRMG